MPDMLVRLYNLPDLTATGVRLAEKGIDIRPALAPERHLVLDWVGQTFGSAWASEAEKAFANTPISCLIAVDKSKCIGFACYDATCRGFFGPTGVDPVGRGRGVGTALLWACLDAMWRVGYGYAIIGGVGPAEFYAKTVGAEIIEDSTPGIYRNMLKE